MREHWPKAALILCGFAAVAVILHQRQPAARSNEPTYQGKPLSVWLSGLDSQDARQAKAALAAMGPKAIPFVLAKLRYGEILHAQGIGALVAIGSPLALHLVTAFADRSEEVRVAAIAALGVLASKQNLSTNTIISALTKRLDDRSAEVRLLPFLPWPVSGLGVFRPFRHSSRH